MAPLANGPAKTRQNPTNPTGRAPTHYHVNWLPANNSGCPASGFHGVSPGFGWAICWLYKRSYYLYHYYVRSKIYNKCKCQRRVPTAPTTMSTGCPQTIAGALPVGFMGFRRVLAGPFAGYTNDPTTRTITMFDLRSTNKCKCQRRVPTLK